MSSLEGLPNSDNVHGDRKVKQALTSFLNVVLEGNEVVPAATKKSLEGKDQHIISHSLEMMRTAMVKLAKNESTGGNATGTTIDGVFYPCVALNGQADKETGKILAFGNFQSIPEKIIKIGTPFTFREAIDVDLKQMSERKKIVNFFGADRFSERARKNIEACIEIYNREHWQEK